MRKTIRLHHLLMLMATVSIMGMAVMLFIFLANLGSAMDEQKSDTVRERVETAENIIKFFYAQEQAGNLNRTEAQTQAKEILRQTRTTHEDYLWINDTQAVMVMHPFQSDLEGKNIDYIKDPKGNPIIKSFVAVATHLGSGYVAYSWPKPGSNEAAPKRSYVKLFAPWQWVIGSGTYLDDIQEAYWQQVRHMVPLIAAIGILFFVLIFWLRNRVLSRAGDEMKDAVTIANKLSNGDMQIPIDLQTDAGAGLLDTLHGKFQHWNRSVVNQIPAFLFGTMARHQREENERRRLGEALKQSHEAIILTEADLCFSYVNPAFTKLFGYTLDEVIGQHVQLMGVSGHQATNPNMVAEQAGHGGRFRGEVLRRSKDGRAIHVLLNVAPVFDKYQLITGYVATMTDLTEIRKAQQAQHDSEQKFRAIFGQTFQLIGLLTPEGKILDENRTALDAFGNELAEIRGKFFWETSPFNASAEAQALIKNAIKKAGAGEFIRFEASAIGQDGQIQYFDFSLKPVRNEQHQVEFLIPEGRDITERKLAENAAQLHMEEITRINSELKELNQKLSQSQGQLLQSEKMASIGVLAAGVAHEINNPVGFIQSNMRSLQKYVSDFLRVVDAYENAELLLKDRKDIFTEVRRLLETLDFAYEKTDVLALLSESLSGLDRVTKIVKDLKDFSRIDAEENWKDEDIHQGLESTLNIVWNELKYKCEVKKEYGTLPRVECLLFQLNQVFINLLVNAAQAIDGHGTITLRTGTQDDRVWIEIADTGKGIPPAQLKQIFDPFFTTKPVGMGTGLGLSVSYSIIQKHKGSIEVQSEVGKGTTFRIWLPVRQASQ